MDAKFSDILKRVEELKKSKDFDLSLEEDLSIAIMNLVSLEEHFFLTAEKTGKSDYFDLLKETREIRKRLMSQMFDQHEGETWCISKHLLSTTMRLMEVATKLQTDGKKEESRKMFDDSYRVFSLFWAVRLKLLNLKNVTKIKKDDKSWSYEDLVSKLVDCCRE